MTVRELGHVVFFVRNLERSTRFYRDVLGFATIKTPDRLQGSVQAFTSGRTHHEMLLIEVGEDAPTLGPGRRAGFYHVGLKVGDRDEDLLAVWRRLEVAGIAVTGQSDHTVTHSLYLADPDGNEVELYVDVPGADWDDPDQVLAPTRPLDLPTPDQS